MAKQRVIQYVNFYTDGSAARKIEPVAPVKKAVLPKQKKQKRKVIRLDPIAILGMAVAACMLIMMLVGISSLNSAREETMTMRNYVDTLAQENAVLQEQYANGYDLEEIRTTALALGLIPSENAHQTTIYVSPAEQPQEEPGFNWANMAALLADIFA